MHAAVVRRTLTALGLACMAWLALAATASAATVVNGDFESGDLSGWTHVSSSGSWRNYTGTTNPVNGLPIAAPPEGTRAAVTGQAGPGLRVLYQDVALEEDQRHTLSLQIYYNSAAALISPDTLARNAPNQQYRIDVLRVTAAIDSVDAADILATVFRTQPGDARVRTAFPASTDLSALAGRTVRLRFAEVDTGGTFSASTDDVRIVSGPDVVASPRTLSFGAHDVSDGPTVVQTSTLTNPGPAVTLTDLALSGDTTQFSRLTDEPGDCTATTALAQGAACDLRVRFHPTTTGAKTSTLTVGSSAGNPSVELTGTGTDTELTVSPDTLAFGSRDVDDGAAPGQSSTITNSGTAPVTLSGLPVEGDGGHFERLTGQPGDCTTTTTLIPGRGCEVRVRFDPTDTGAKAAALTVTSPKISRVIALTGAGTRTEPTPAGTQQPQQPPEPPLPPPTPRVAEPWTLTRIAAPRVTRGTGAFRVRTGYVAACPAGGPACTGRLTLKTLRRSPTTGTVMGRFLTDSVAVMTLSPGAQRHVSFTLNPRGTRLLGRLGSFTTRLRGSMRAGTGAPVVRAEVVLIGAPAARPYSGVANGS